jgi:hypothetical protein
LEENGFLEEKFLYVMKTQLLEMGEVKAKKRVFLQQQRRERQANRQFFVKKEKSEKASFSRSPPNF